MRDERTCVVPENIHAPSTEDHWKFRGGGRGFKGSNFRGVGGGGHGKVFSKGWWITYKTLKATYDRPEAQKHTDVCCFETEVNTPGHWDEVNIVSFNVSVFLWVSYSVALQSPEEWCVFGVQSKWFKMVDITGVLSSSCFCPTNIKEPFLSVDCASLFATFTCRKHIFDRFHVLSVFIGGSNS